MKPLPQTIQVDQAEECEQFEKFAANFTRKWMKMSKVVGVDSLRDFAHTPNYVGISSFYFQVKGAQP